MGYILNHRIFFNNIINQNILIELYKKDFTPVSITTLTGIDCSISYSSGRGDKFDTIISCEANIGIRIKKTDIVSFTDFIVSFYDEWQVKIYCDDAVTFIGFLTPSEGECEFKDKPYEIQLSATDGLGFLKNVKLSKIDGTEFRAEYFFIDYIKACLSKTLLDLPIDIYCNIFEISMSDRIADPTSDLFDKMKLDYRTFQTNPTTFTDCYSVLLSILSEHFSIYQSNGKWVILRIAEMQGSVGPHNWYSTYKIDGTKTGQQVLTGPMQVAQHQMLHPREADQRISTNFSNKSVKHTYDYNQWPELFKNIFFSRGTLDHQSANDKYYTISEWDYGRPSGNPNLLPGLSATPKHVYRHDVVTDFGVTTDSEIQMEADFDNVVLFQSTQGMPITQGDKISINYETKCTNNITGATVIFAIGYLKGDDGITYCLQNSTVENDQSTSFWKPTPISFNASLKYTFSVDTRNYSSISVNTDGAPVSGIFRWAFRPDSIGGTLWYLKSFRMDYHPMVAGSYIDVKSDFWLTEQTTNYFDIVDTTVDISDSTHKVLKGAILKGTGTTDINSPLAAYDWHRLGVVEHRHYKELVNLGRYNASYRRTWKIQGSFGGTTFQANDDSTIIQPLSFHKQFYFPNSTELNNYYFMLVPPLKIDLVKGKTTATFVDCYNPITNDGNEEGNHHEYNYTFDDSIN